MPAKHANERERGTAGLLPAEYAEERGNRKARKGVRYLPLPIAIVKGFGK